MKKNTITAEKSNHLTKSIKSLPSHWYYDAKHYHQELEKIWNHNWIYVGSETALKEPRSYQTINIGDQNIVIVRDKNNILQAYHNTCRHRGSILCPENQGKLKTNLLVCPYHQWSYSIENGNLRGTTSFMLPNNFKKSEYGLFRVGLKVWKGLIFINLNLKKKWKDDQVFQEYDSILTYFPIEKMVLGHRWRKVVQCNWKIYWENYSECLHCPNIHPELSDLVPLYSRRLMSIKDAPNWQEQLKTGHPKHVGGLKPGCETWSTDGSAQGHAIKGIKGFKDQSYSTTWPSMFLGAYADHIRTVRILPLDQERTELVAEWLFEEKTLLDKNYQKNKVTDFAILVMEQDSHASELNQKGLHSNQLKQGVLMPEEYTIRNFHRWLKKELK